MAPGDQLAGGFHGGGMCFGYDGFYIGLGMDGRWVMFWAIWLSGVAMGFALSSLITGWGSGD